MDPEVKKALSELREGIEQVEEIVAKGRKNIEAETNPPLKRIFLECQEKNEKLLTEAKAGYERNKAEAEAV
jgi:TATA-binding protein-associated factor Taf7